MWEVASCLGAWLSWLIWVYLIWPIVKEVAKSKYTDVNWLLPIWPCQLASQPGFPLYCTSDTKHVGQVLVQATCFVVNDYTLHYKYPYRHKS